MIVQNVSPNLVERLQMMNPKSFVDLYENKKKRTTRSTRTRNYQTRGTQQGNTSKVMEVHAVQQPIRFSIFN